MKNLRSSASRGLEIFAKLAIGLAFLFLPFTSLPLLSKLMQGTEVAPASIIFIFLLVVAWLPFFLLRGGKLPGETKPFLIFVIVALIASAAAFFLPFPPYKEYTLVGAEAKAVFTLVIGTATYFIIALWHRESSQFRWAFWMINIAGLYMLAWSFVQLSIILLHGGDYPHLMVRIQEFLSTRPLLDIGFHTRVGGFTYEPSWLAHMLNMLFLPYWLAATLTGYSVARKSCTFP